MRGSLLAGCVLFLAACASTPAERAARAQARIDEMIQTYGPACEKLGYRRDNDKWRECVLQLAWQDELRYSAYPTTTSCFGHHGFYDCTTF